MRDIVKLTLRTIKGSFGRFIAIFAIIALGVGFFSGIRITKDAMIKTGWAKGTTLTITIGENQFLSQSKGTSNFEKTPYEGTVMMSLTSDAAEIKCHNSYGLEQTYSCIYSLSLNYGK